MGANHPRTKFCPSCLEEKKTRAVLCTKCNKDCPICHKESRNGKIFCKECNKLFRKWDEENDGHKWPDDYIRMKKGHPERTKADELPPSDEEEDEDEEEEKKEVIEQEKRKVVEPTPSSKRSKLEVLESIDTKLQTLIILQTTPPVPAPPQRKVDIKPL